MSESVGTARPGSETAADETAASATTAGRVRERRLAVLAVAIAVIPIVVAVIRALGDGWIPFNDDGLTAIRTLDVLGSDTPLTGLASSASLVAPRPFNHLGPLQFQLLALPVELFGPGPGLVIGMGLVNAASVALVGWFGWRIDRLRGCVLAALVAGTLAWTMGSELLYDAWQPHATLLPFLALLFGTAVLAAGDLRVAPAVVVIATYVLQTHVTYIFLVPAVALVGLGLGLVQLPGERRARWRVARRPLGLALAVGAILWAAPVVEELTADHGNISRMVDAARHPSDQVVGLRGGLRLTAAVVASPPGWLPWSFRDTLRAGSSLAVTVPTTDGLGLAGTAVSALALGAVLGALTFILVLAARRHARHHVAGAAIALVAIAAAWATAAQVTTEIVGVAAHQFRFLWPVAAFVAFVAVRATLSALARTEVGRPPRVRWAATAVGWVLLVVVAVAAVPSVPAAGGPQLSLPELPVVRDLAGQLGAARGRGPILLEWSGLEFQEPYSSALTAELVRREVEVTTDAAFLLRQIGEHRRDDGRAPVKIFYRRGADARRPRIGPFERIAFHHGRGPRDTIGVFIGPVDVPSP